MMATLARLIRGLVSRVLPRRASSPPERVVQLLFAVDSSTKQLWFSGPLPIGAVIAVGDPARYEAMTVLGLLRVLPRGHAHEYRVIRALGGRSKSLPAGARVTIVAVP